MSAAKERIQCVVFDAVGTLIHADPGVAQVYQKVAARYGVELTNSEMASRFRSAMSSRSLSAQTSEAIEWQFWRDTVRTVIGDVSDPEACFQELYDHFARADSWRLSPTAISTIRSLRENGLSTAVASNFDQRLPGILSNLIGLEEFDDIIISSQIGWRKPHREFFEHLLQALRFSAAETLMVGDDRQLDILPARELGMNTLHLIENSHSAQSSGEERCIHSLREILNWCGIDG